jgi:hypothetical protein
MVSLYDSYWMILCYLMRLDWELTLIWIEVILESKGFMLSKTKTKFMGCKFSRNANRDEGIVELDGAEIPKSDRLIIHKDGECCDRQSSYTSLL